MTKLDRTYKEDFGERFQRHILACACRIPGFVERCRTVLNHEYFTSAPHQAIAQALLDHVDQEEELPSQSMLIEDSRQLVGPEDLELIEDELEGLYTEEIPDADGVERRVVQFGKRMALALACIEGAEAVESGDLTKIDQLVKDALLVGEDMSDVGIDYVDELENRIPFYLDPAKSSVDKIETGIAHLDAMLDGGLERGELGVLLAPPKRGKTTALVNFGYGALIDLIGLNVVHYSCEIKDHRVIARYDDRLLGMHVKKRNTDRRGFVGELRKRVQSYAHGNLFVKGYNTREASVETLRSHLSILAARGFPPDLVIVDYANIIRAVRRIGEFRHEQAGIVEDLRKLAGDFNCVVWTAAQTNRASISKETVTMDDVAETIEIVHVADVIVALCQSDDEKIDQRCRLFGAALRNQEDGRTVECMIRRDSCMIRSTALIDASGARILTRADNEAEFEEGKSERLERARKKTGKKKAPTKRDPGKRGPRKKKKAPTKRIAS